MAIKKFNLESDEDWEQLGFNHFENSEELAKHLQTNPNYLVLGSGTVYSGVEKFFKDQQEFYKYLWGLEEVKKHNDESYSKANEAIEDLPDQEKWLLVEKLIDNSIKLYEKKQKELLNSKLVELGIEGEETNEVNFIDNTVQWNGSNTELAELLKALIESKKLEPGLTQKEIFGRFSLFLNYDLKETKGITDFSKRPNNRGNLTKFLDLLKENLNNWFETKEEKKDYT